MYTVLRFVEKCPGRALEAIAAKLRSRFPGTSVERDVGIPNRISIEMSSDPDWDKHQEAIFRCLVQCTEICLSSRDAGIELGLDIAIEPEDIRGRLLTDYVIDNGLLAILSSHSVSLCISIYGSSEQ